MSSWQGMASAFFVACLCHWKWKGQTKAKCPRLGVEKQSRQQTWNTGVSRKRLSIFHRKIGLEMPDKKRRLLVPTTVHPHLQPPIQQAQFSAPPAVVCPCAAAGLAAGDLPFGCQSGLALSHILPRMTQIHSSFPSPVISGSVPWKLSSVGGT